MTGILTRFALFSVAIVIAPRFSNAAPILPSAPNAGWLYDETYSGFGSTIKDSFGTMYGLTAAGTPSNTASAPGGPTTSSDTPFLYAGDTSFSTIGGPGTGTTSIWHGSFGIGPYRALVNGASAVTVSAWLKYEEGALTTGGTNTQNNNANAFFAMTLDGGFGGSGIYMNLPTGTGNKNKVSVVGTSISTDAEQKLVTTGTLTPGSWNHIVAVLDFPNDQIRVSLNGGVFETGTVNFGSNTAVAGSTVGTTPDIIPARSASAEYIGLLDEVAIWTSALSQDNVDWLQQNSLHNLVPVPEPCSMFLLIVGSTTSLLSRRRGRGTAPAL